MSVLVQDNRLFAPEKFDPFPQVWTTIFLVTRAIVWIVARSW